jgi:hypothetical protein
MSRWEQRRLHQAVSLLRDRKSLKARAIPPHTVSMLSFGFFIGAYIFNWCEDLVISGAAPSLCRILEKQNHLMTNAKATEKLDSSATSFAFQGFYWRSSSGFVSGK